MSHHKFNPTLAKCEQAEKFAQKLRKIAIANASKRVDNGRQASNKTISDSIEHAARIARTIWGLGYMLKEPENIGARHIEALLKYAWQCHPNAGTFSVWITQTRKISRWLGKPGLVHPPTHYVPLESHHLLVRPTVARKSKSPQGNGILIDDLIAKADHIDLRFGAMVRLIAAFGLRRKEVLMLRPHIDDRVAYLDIRARTGKGTLARTIPILTGEQRQWLDSAKSLLQQPSDHMGWPESESTIASRSLIDINYDRFQYYMKKLGLTKKQAGVTAHGIRAAYVEQRFIALGLVPPTLGGLPGQLSNAEEKKIRLIVSAEIGHSRPSVTGAYVGSYRSINEATPDSKKSNSFNSGSPSLPDTN